MKELTKQENKKYEEHKLEKALYWNDRYYYSDAEIILNNVSILS